MDCDGLSPFRFPMNMMRSCSILVQDHYPNRLGTLFILRLPPVVQVLAQTFLQILRPTTREKVRILGNKNHKILSELLKTLPAFLGTDCDCSSCKHLSTNNPSNLICEIGEGESSGSMDYDDVDANDFISSELPFLRSCDHVLRTAIIAILMMWILIAFFSAMHNTDTLSSLS
ncbi:phosphatidylinositol/phosphatidylcholine transfer protein SFH2-like [Phalaenopsis equestris]|uniref:phosphatidylinositol/phosphatidylcholine transfer protein SFH2-like n=1 Tax=Phalaenopsis equestris TaxID=78828 RepID=UPI0009E56752|nr:phosphatidylinositol/phosphatidylcholine transfer protein SFH2-like [Phalaenopsis equestris]